MPVRSQNQPRGKPGFLLVEILVALALVSTLGIALLKAMQTSYVATGQLDRQATADLLVRSQIESVFAEAYLPPGNSYTPISAPSGFTLTAEALTYSGTNTAVTLVRVRALFNGETVRTVETLRAAR